MKLTTKGRYAVTAMLDVALFSDGQAVTLADIAERQHLSVSYLEQLFGKLRRAGLVVSIRGPGGGYRLNRETDAISLADIIRAVDEPTDVTQCKGRENCRGESRCLTHDLWAELSDRVYEYLRSHSLSDLLAMASTHRAERSKRKARKIDVTEAPMQRMAKGAVSGSKMPVGKKRTTSNTRVASAKPSGKPEKAVVGSA